MNNAKGLARRTAEVPDPIRRFCRRGMKMIRSLHLPLVARRRSRMRVKGATAILMGLLGGLASLNARAAQAPNGLLNADGAAGPAALHWHDRTRLAQAA